MMLQLRKKKIKLYPMMSNRPNMLTLLDFTNHLNDAFLHNFDVIKCIIFLKDGGDSIELDQIS